MSWDVYIQDLPPVASIADIPEDFRPRSIGERATLIARIMEAVPFAEQQDNFWFFVRTPDLDVSISLEMEAGTDRVNAVAVHTHGGTHAAACVAALVKAIGLRALDTATSEFFNADAPEHGHAQWAAYCDQILRRS